MDGEPRKTGRLDHILSGAQQLPKIKVTKKQIVKDAKMKGIVPKNLVIVDEY